MTNMNGQTQANNGSHRVTRLRCELHIQKVGRNAVLAFHLFSKRIPDVSGLISESNALPRCLMFLRLHWVAQNAELQRLVLA